MSGSRFGRGRAGRLALLAAAVLIAVFLIYLYRSSSSEMARLKDLHVKCAQQQEALAAQLQVIYDYKVQLEKTLSNEKSSNAAAKEELQQKASRERSLRDKDSLEAMQRYNSLQQHYKILQSEHQDLQEDCKKKEEVALQNSNKLEATLKELRIELKRAAEEKEKSLENLKRKFEELASEKEQLEEKYESLKKTTGDNSGNVERLQKQVMQLQRELDEAKGSPHFSVGGVKIENDNPQVVQPRHVNEPILDSNNSNNNNNNNNDNDNMNNINLANNNINGANNEHNEENEKPGASDNNQMQMIRPSSQQQVSPPSDELQGGRNPQPLQAPQERHLDDGVDKFEAVNGYKPDDSLGKDEARFENRDGNIVPVGPNEQYDLPQHRPVAAAESEDKLPDAQEQQQQQEEEQHQQQEQQKQVLAPPNQPDGPAPSAKEPKSPLSSKGPMVVPMFKPQANGWQADQPGNEQNSVGDPNDFD